MKTTTTIWFPKHGESLEFKVQYIEDKELYHKGISIESIKIHGVEMLDYFNESAINDFEDLLLENLK